MSWQDALIDINEVPDQWARYAIRQILEEYGDNVVIRPKPLQRFGENLDLGTSIETVWEVDSNEVYVTDNLIDAISSGDAGDTQDVTLVGHTVDGSGNFAEVEQTATLTGQDSVALTTPLARIENAFNDSSAAISGDVWVYQDTATVSSGVPTESSLAHIVIRGSNGYQNSFKAATTTPDDTYLLITEFFADVREKTSAIANFDFQVRLKGKNFRERFDRVASQTAGTTYSPRPYLIVPPNADVRVRAVASASSVEVQAGFSGIYAIVR